MLEKLTKCGAIEKDVTEEGTILSQENLRRILGGKKDECKQDCETAGGSDPTVNAAVKKGAG